MICAGFCSAIFLLAASPAISAAYELRSPDGQVALSVEFAGQANFSGQANQGELRYSIAYRKNLIVQDSGVSFVGADGKTIGRMLRVTREPAQSQHDSTWKPVYGERSSIRDHYNQISIDAVDNDSGHTMRFDFRCYDTGVAFRTRIIGGDDDPRIRIKEEQSEFRFLADHTAWYAHKAQDSYHTRRLSQLGDRAERPLTIKLSDDLYAAIAEAGLEDFATMQLRTSKEAPYCLVSRLGGSVQTDRELQTPWRVVMLGESPGALLEGNDLILNLSQPCAIADTSWIRPGKVIREVTLTTEGGLACVDFAVENNFQHIEFDAGWYGMEYSDASDARTVTVDPSRSKGPLDLHRVIAYAKQRGIGVIVYVNRRALETQLDEILPLYQEWGIAGVKYGFVNTETQHWTSWLHEAIRKAAEHRLMVDVHDNYRPVGYSRTYPNLMTQEGVCGDEVPPSSETALTTLFTRNLAGAADHTICYFDKRVDERWTHAHQLAKAVCTYSPWQFIYWYDTPLPAESGKAYKSHIVDTPELEFFAKVPTVWDETRVLAGSIGEYAVIARRSGEQWFVGAMNNRQERELDLPLDFLTPGVEYQARVYSDDQSLDTITRIRVDDQLVDATTELSAALLANGGQAIWLRPVDSPGVASRPPARPK